MKVSEAIAEVKELKPNHYSDEKLLEWLNKIESQIYNNIILTHENSDNIEYTEYGADDGDKELIASGMYEDLYRFYVESQIDYSNQEINKFNNSSAMHNAFYSGYERWYNRHYMPLHPTNKPIFYKEV